MPPGQYRSRGEYRVAACLDRGGLTYQYEPRLTLYAPRNMAAEYNMHEQWVRPDFYLPEHHAVIEYAGRMDLPEYRARHNFKTQLYQSNGIKCYEIFPEDIRRPHWEPRLLDDLDTTLTSNTRPAISPRPAPPMFNTARKLEQMAAELSTTFHRHRTLYKH